MKFVINIQKTVTSNQVFDIESDNEEEAKNEALKLAKDIIFKDEKVNYSIVEIKIHNIKKDE